MDYSILILQSHKWGIYRYLSTYEVEDMFFIVFFHLSDLLFLSFVVIKLGIQGCGDHINHDETILKYI